MGRRGKRYKHLLDKIEETRGYWNLKEEALQSTTYHYIVLHSTREHALEKTVYLS